jgi:GntR family transcriptional regulator
MSAEIRGDAPLYRTLARDLTRRIAAGEFETGAPLPPERRLAETHGVSRVTVRRAVEQLARDGLVEQRQGSGTYVARRLSQPLSTLTSLSEDVAARGLTARSRVLARGVGTVTPEESIGMGLPPGTRVSRLTRLRLAEGAPLVLEASTVLREALPDPTQVGVSLYEAMAGRGLRPVRAVQRLSAVALDAHLAGLLETEEGAPGLAVLRVGYAAAGRAVEYTRSTFRGDRWDFVAELS